MDKKLMRNEYDKMIAGVSSGIAEYMQVDVTIIRLLFVLSTIFLFGTGILVYLILWIVVPVNRDPGARFSKFNDYFKSQGQPSPFPHEAPFRSDNSDISNDGGRPAAQNRSSASFNAGSFSDPKSRDNFKPFAKDNDTGRTVGGLFLLVIGVYFLLNEFDIIPFWFSLRKLWPLVFVAIGISFILKSKRKNVWEDWKGEEEKKSTIDLNKDKDKVDLNKDNEHESSTNNPL